jgi:hypothetical protein
LLSDLREAPAKGVDGLLLAIRLDLAFIRMALFWR